MAKLPDIVSKAWDDRDGPIVFVTTNAQGIPNAIYATCTSKFDEETLVVADNYFNKTKQNIDTGSQGVILFLTKEKKSFQVKGNLEYHTQGPIFDDMKTWNPTRLPGHAAATLRVEEVYQGAKRLL